MSCVMDERIFKNIKMTMITECVTQTQASEQKWIVCDQIPPNYSTFCLVSCTWKLMMTSRDTQAYFLIFFALSCLVLVEFYSHLKNFTMSMTFHLIRCSGRHVTPLNRTVCLFSLSKNVFIYIFNEMHEEK